MSELVVWKKWPLLAVGALVLCGLSFWVARATAPTTQPAPMVTSMPPATGETPSPTDWLACIDGNTVPKKTYFEAVLRNKCSTTLDEFVVTFKLYDLSDARVGWVSTNIGKLEAGEKVRFREEYNLKENPKLADGVGRVTVAEFVPQK